MANRTLDLRTAFVAPFRRLTVETIYQAIREVVEENEEFIADLNREQLHAGLLDDGRPITPDYTDVTVTLKDAKGQPSDRVTLKDKGDFYGSIYTQVFADSFLIDATDPKTAELMAKYSDRIVGLTTESTARLVAFFRPQIIHKLQLLIR
ncbi:hypothetical protein [Spirosoma sordidisoli]|uniref:Uncharacterized protein n=1 Tax=Spirosoma sordidisoli TaxID=2502893 RepID=A0A4Q2UPP0_9BACT|nr:hypothetical protein [Spirosoma sordidisoli]RYC70872.1 hypothetical protein EQG79_01590 [Spirosoma sordidisoli]